MVCCMCGGKMEPRTLPTLIGPGQSPCLESVLQCVDCHVGTIEIEFTVLFGEDCEDSDV